MQPFAPQVVFRGRRFYVQLLAFVDYESFRSCVRRYEGDRGVRQLSCWEQFLAMAFAQFTYRESLRDIEDPGEQTAPEDRGQGTRRRRWHRAADRGTCGN